MAFQAPADWLRMTTIDAHTAGEPLRIVTDGFPDVPGETMLAKRRYARRHLDHLRKLLMWEPRGHADMYGCVLTPPVTPDGDVGVLFLHNEGYSTMCGHGIIALVKVGLESGRLAVDGTSPTIRIDTPAGRITATATVVDGRVRRVSFRNVASFLLERDLQLEVPGVGKVCCDIAFGGAFYAYVDAGSVGLVVDPRQQRHLIEVGMQIKRAVMADYDVAHPAGDEDLGYLYGTIFYQPGTGQAHSRNVCIFAEGEVDRSPTGTGVSGRAAILHARGQLATGETLRIESLIGSHFEVRAAATTRVGELSAIVPEVTGTAHVTGQHEFLVDPDDPLREGFLLR
ncbi:MAG: proline racemase family protein [Acidobacteriota bacterium]